MDNNVKSDPIRFFCSWSGGKDSCLALFRMIKTGNVCEGLFTMIDETGEHSRSHGLPPDLLRKQSQALELPITTAAANWNSYENEFKKKLEYFKTNGLKHGVFGDIDLEPHRAWVDRVCSECNFTAHLPLWQEKRRTLVSEFIGADFKALIVVVNTNMIPERFLGRVIDHKLVCELENIGVDACGENGEFHTFVYDGPLFSNPVDFRITDIIAKDEYRFLSLD